MNKKQQSFYKKNKVRFYLGKPKSTSPCMIYLVVRIDGKEYKLSTHLKVYSNQWNQEKQLAVISNVQSKLDNHNNKIVNEQINKLRRYYSEFFEYICNNYVTDVFETLKRFIYRDVAKNKFVLL